jgi:hypothetical protein
MIGCVCTVYKTVQLKSKINTLGPDWPQYDRPTHCVIAQQHSSATFVACSSIPARKNLAFLLNVGLLAVVT